MEIIPSSSITSLVNFVMLFPCLFNSGFNWSAVLPELYILSPSWAGCGLEWFNLSHHALVLLNSENLHGVF